MVDWGNRFGQSTNQRGPFKIPKLNKKENKKENYHPKSPKIMRFLRFNEANTYRLEGDLAKMKGIIVVNRKNKNVNTIVTKLKTIVNKTNIPKNNILKKIDVIFDYRYTVDNEVKKHLLTYLK